MALGAPRKTLSSPPPLSVSARQVIAFRLRRLGLQQATPDLRDAVGAVGLPDFPPGAARSALAPRLRDAQPDGLERVFEGRQLVRMRAMRGAPVVLRTEDYDLFAAGLLPPDEPSMRAFIGAAADSVDRAKLTAVEAVALVSGHASKALAGATGAALDRDQLHARLRDALEGGPAQALLPHCRTCDSHHVHPSLLYAVALQARLVLFPRGEGPYQLALFDRWRGRRRRAAPLPADAPVELLRRFLRSYGPATTADFAAWSGLGGGQPRAIWARLADQLLPVEIKPSLPRARTRFLLAEDVGELTSAADGPEDGRVLLLAPGDPLLQLRDRETLIPDRAMQKVVWKNLSPSGLLLVGPSVAGVVRLQKRKAGLHVTIDAVKKLDARVLEAVDEEAGKLARVRGCAGVQVTWN